MKKLVMLVMVALVGLAAGTAAAAADTARTKGGGKTDNGWDLRWNASHELAPSGEIEVSAPDGTKYHGTVACLDVEGNLAVLTGTLDVGPAGLTHFRFLVLDGGEGNGSVDKVEFEALDRQARCDAQTPRWVLVTGNAQVKG